MILLLILLVQGNERLLLAPAVANNGVSLPVHRWPNSPMGASGREAMPAPHHSGGATLPP
jgi:hypothetical protein